MQKEKNVMDLVITYDNIRGIARGWLPDYNFTGEERDYDAHWCQMIMCRAAEIIESNENIERD